MTSLELHLSRLFYAWCIRGLLGGHKSRKEPDGWGHNTAVGMTKYGPQTQSNNPGSILPRWHLDTCDILYISGHRGRTKSLIAFWCWRVPQLNQEGVAKIVHQLPHPLLLPYVSIMAVVMSRSTLAPGMWPSKPVNIAQCVILGKLPGAACTSTSARRVLNLSVTIYHYRRRSQHFTECLEHKRKNPNVGLHIWPHKKKTRWCVSNFLWQHQQVTTSLYHRSYLLQSGLSQDKWFHTEDRVELPSAGVAIMMHI